ncbi:hypothetical protein [Sporosarcina newyorkensis]|uniref:hypothetical protein n=1 Tax=Sporosarcina newyorkensis TaxID=759851 RepID=UPI003D08FE51
MSGVWCGRGWVWLGPGRVWLGPGRVWLGLDTDWFGRGNVTLVPDHLRLPNKSIRPVSYVDTGLFEVLFSIGG